MLSRFGYFVLFLLSGLFLDFCIEFHSYYPSFEKIRKKIQSIKTLNGQEKSHSSIFKALQCFSCTEKNQQCLVRLLNNVLDDVRGEQEESFSVPSKNTKSFYFWKVYLSQQLTLSQIRNFLVQQSDVIALRENIEPKCKAHFDKECEDLSTYQVMQIVFSQTTGGYFPDAYKKEKQLNLSKESALRQQEFLKIVESCDLISKEDLL